MTSLAIAFGSLLAICQGQGAVPPDSSRPTSSRPDELLPPIRIETGGAAIDTEIGHAGPFVGDFDEDGVNDLLVGQFGGGLLWLFRNEGTNAVPKLAAGTKFQEGRPEGTVPTG